MATGNSVGSPECRRCRRGRWYLVGSGWSRVGVVAAIQQTRLGTPGSASLTGIVGVRGYGGGVSIPTSVWFIVAVVALGLGLLMLRASQRAGGGGGGHQRDRRRWAEQKEWEYLDSDPVLPSTWRYGTIHQGGPGVARNLVTGSVPTAEGRRMVYVFDHEQAGRLSSVVCAVQRRSAVKGAFELRLPSAPLPEDAGLDLLEPVGQRYAFVSDPGAIGPLITPRLVRAADEIGDEVELLWGEDSWVLCTAPLNYSSERLQHLLDRLVEVAGALEEAARSNRPVDPAPRFPTDSSTSGGAADLTDSAEFSTSGPGTVRSGTAAASWTRSLSTRAAESHTTDPEADKPSTDSTDKLPTDKLPTDGAGS
jgi:hypothetical protein